MRQEQKGGNSINCEQIQPSVSDTSYPCITSGECETAWLITGDWVLVTEMGVTTVGRTAVEVVTGGRDCGHRGKTTATLYTMRLNIQHERSYVFKVLQSTWITWWMMCGTVGWAVPALAPVAGRKTVLELDITAAAAAPSGQRAHRPIKMQVWNTGHNLQDMSVPISPHLTFTLSVRGYL